MKIKLNKPFAANSAVDEFDVKQIKKALNRLGYYQPYEKVGITGIPDMDVFSALKTFQKDQGLQPTGAARPGDETVSKLSSEVGKKKSGKYIWRTVSDDKVRGAHAALNGTVRDLADSPDPGEEFNCRCWAEPVDENPYPDAIKPVYPEFWLLPFLGIGRIAATWRAWILAGRREPEWRLGGKKSALKWQKQLESREWTPERITETIKRGERHPAPNEVNKGNTATRYQYKDRFVVKDDQTNEILQISGKNFIPREIKP